MGDVTKALILSKRCDVIDTFFGKKKQRVGYDIFTITGHITVGDEVYLTLSNAGWVRSKEALVERQARKSDVTQGS